MESACPSSVEQSGGPAHKSTSLEPAQGEEKARLRCGDRSQGRPPGQGKWGPTMRHLGAGVHALIRMVAAWPGSFAPSMELDVQKSTRFMLRKLDCPPRKLPIRTKWAEPALLPCGWEIFGGGGDRWQERPEEKRFTGDWTRTGPALGQSSSKQGRAQPRARTTHSGNHLTVRWGPCPRGMLPFVH